MGNRWKAKKKRKKTKPGSQMQRWQFAVNKNCASVYQTQKHSWSFPFFDRLKNNHIALLSASQNCQPVQNLPNADAVQTVGRWKDRLTWWPSGEICGELHHQKPSWEVARLWAEIRNRWSDISGQRGSSDPLLLCHPAQDGQPALRYEDTVDYNEWT